MYEAVMLKQVTFKPKLWKRDGEIFRPPNAKFLLQKTVHNYNFLVNFWERNPVISMGMHVKGNFVSDLQISTC